MKKPSKKAALHEEPSAASLREIPEVDFDKVKFRRRLAPAPTPVNVRILDEDLEAVFPDSASVNQALRALLVLAAVVPRAGTTRKRKAA